MKLKINVGLKVMNRALLISFISFFILSGCFDIDNDKKTKDRSYRSKRNVKVDYSKPYLERRKNFKTKLSRKGPAPQEWEEEDLLPGVEQFYYKSGKLKLKAWLYAADKTKQNKAIVYFHGGFASSMYDMILMQPFIDAGFVVLCPALRGENGNPGHFELFLGEVDDARAAIKMLAKKSYVDEDHIYAFGHSAGGGISSLLSLFNDLPLKHTGACGGLYDASTFRYWNDFRPFPYNDLENSVRAFVENIRHMKFKHHSFIGRNDYGIKVNIDKADKERKEHNIKFLKLYYTKGDHLSSLEPAIKAYLKLCK